MKRLFIKLMLGITFLFLGTLQADAKMYILKPKPSTPSHHKIGMPAFRPVIADIDAETGELTVMFRTTINSAEISILLIATGDDVIAEFTISIEEE